MSTPGKEQQTTWIHFAILLLAVLLAYSKTFGAGFMSWDDIDYVFNTPDIVSFSGEHFANWWTQFYIGNYQPLPMMSYAFDYLLGGDQPFIYHLTSIIWHILDVALVYACIKRLNNNAYIALFVALLFAIHPVQTESVSWIAARNKVMNGFFFMLAIYLYIGYIRNSNNKTLMLIYVCGLAAYLSKLTAVTLPFALLAVDVWQGRPLYNKRVWLEKLPLILMAIPIGLYNLQAQDEVAFLYARADNDLLHTIVYAGYAYVQYIINLLVPVRLSVLYPYPTEIGIIHVLYLVIAIGIVVTGFVAYRKKWNVLAGGILFYTVNIAIVLQFVQFGEVLMADRYLYLACIGIWYPIAYYIYQFFTRNDKRVIPTSILTILCLLYATATFARNDIWLSELNFWKSVTDKFPGSSVAQSSLGGVYMKENNASLALQHINEAIRLDDYNYKAWYNKGVLLLRRSDTRGALNALNRAIAINQYSKALFTRALIYQQTGNCDKALPDIEQVLRKEPQNARAHYIMADCKEQAGDMQAAIKHYNEAINYEDTEPLFYLRRGLAEAKTGDSKSGIEDMSKAIQLRSNYAEAWYWRGMIKHRSGQQPCSDLQQAYKLGLQQAGKALQDICQQ